MVAWSRSFSVQVLLWVKPISLLSNTSDLDGRMNGRFGSFGESDRGLADLASRFPDSSSRAVGVYGIVGLPHRHSPSRILNLSLPAAVPVREDAGLRWGAGRQSREFAVS